MSDEDSYLAAVKAVSMVIMFLLVMVLGNLPIRWKRFKKSTTLISLAGGFSGGLFIAVGVLHLLPEAKEGFDEYYESIEADEEQFPWPNFICVVCFACVLFIEKVAFVSCMGHANDGHDHNHGDAEEHVHLPVGLKRNHSPDAAHNKAVRMQTELQAIAVVVRQENEEEVLQKEVEAVGAKESPELQACAEVRRTNSVTRDEEHDKKTSKFTPYILQIAIGIHAVFEGMAIGLETNYGSCIGIALAVVCHKWAEGLTLGIAFSKADVEIKMATIMIVIQSVMNPIGIMIGWLLSDEGALITGIFESISAGTFLYIAAAEVIVNEFSLKRHRYLKFVLFMVALGFVSSLYFIEQATGE